MTPPAPTYTAPALAQGGLDKRLTPIDARGLLVLWQHLSPAAYQPMKAEALGSLLGVRRATAARVLKNLIAHGYLLVRQTDPRAPREFLLVNVIARAA